MYWPHTQHAVPVQGDLARSVIVPSLAPVPMSASESESESVPVSAPGAVRARAAVSGMSDVRRTVSGLPSPYGMRGRACARTRDSFISSAGVDM